jgi:glucose/arabinose dehydrogenase
MGFANGGGPNGNDPTQVQRLDSIAGAILRIDPRSPSESGGTKGLGDYTIPPVNKFAADGDPNTLGEIFAYGFRNAQRFSWDLTDGTLYVSDIGEGSIEEINIVVEGNDYGWMTREGYFDNGLNRDGTRSQVYALPEDILSGERPDGFDYPVVAYDHNEGRSIAGGYAYHGRIPELRGKFVFGDIQRGRLFVSDLAAMKAADDGIPRTTAPIEEVQLYTTDDNGNRTYVTFRELIEARLGGGVVRADMQISQTHDGELLITSRQDGTIRMLGSE